MVSVYYHLSASFDLLVAMELLFCCLFLPQVMFGTSDGHVIVMTSSGTLVRHFTINEGNEIAAMAWSCEKFNMIDVDVPSDEQLLSGNG